METVQIFKALGDPIRLELVQRLTRDSDYTLTALSEGLGISRQGARNHLKVLVDAKLICLEKSGRETKVKLERNALEVGRRFIAKLERQWDDRLENLKELLEN